MYALTNSKRIIGFFYNRRRELFSKELWSQVYRVTKSRLIVQPVSKEEFRHNLRIIQKRPWNLHIELTNLCNANCIFCAYQYQTRPRHFISDEIYKKALDDYCHIGGGDLMLEVVVGDPVIDPKFIQRVKQARERPEIASIETITNGIALRTNEIPDVIKSGISRIMISTGPWRKDLYEAIYRNGSYNRMRKNVRDLLSKNFENGCPIEITMAFRSNLSMKETLSLPDYQEVAHLPHKIQFNTDFDTWTGEIKKEDLLPGMHIRPRSRLETEPCIWLYDGPIIFANGNVGLCGCRDYNANSELIVGNIMNESLTEIWTSTKVRELRERFIKEKYPDICTKCTSYANLDLYRTKAGSERAVLTNQRLATKNRDD